MASRGLALALTAVGQVGELALLGAPLSGQDVLGLVGVQPERRARCRVALPQRVLPSSEVIAGIVKGASRDIDNLVGDANCRWSLPRCPVSARLIPKGTRLCLPGGKEGHHFVCDGRESTDLLVVLIDRPTGGRR